MELNIIGKYRLLNVSLAGEVDHHAASGIRSAVDRELQRTGVKNLAFDFSKVTFMDSSGIGVIMGRYRIVKLLGGQVYIYGASAEIRRIIEMSGIQQIVTVGQTLDECMELLTA